MNKMIQLLKKITKIYFNAYSELMQPYMKHNRCPLPL